MIPQNGSSPLPNSWSKWWWVPLAHHPIGKVWCKWWFHNISPPSTSKQVMMGSSCSLLPRVIASPRVLSQSRGKNFIYVMTNYFICTYSICTIDKTFHFIWGQFWEFQNQLRISSCAYEIKDSASCIYHLLCVKHLLHDRYLQKLTRSFSTLG